jgi:hypothetical protein
MAVFASLRGLVLSHNKLGSGGRSLQLVACVRRADR